MTVNISPELATQLRKKAAEYGVDCESFVEAVVRNELETGRAPTAQVNRTSFSERQAATARIRERRKGTKLGPGLTIRELIEEGRRY